MLCVRHASSVNQAAGMAMMAMVVDRMLALMQHKTLDVLVRVLDEASYNRAARAVSNKRTLGPATRSA
jgi:hypothetical protein